VNGSNGARKQTIYVVRDGKVAWTYSIPATEELGDCTELSNGNILFSRRLGASEITPDKKTIWKYEAPANTEIHTACPVGKDRVLLMQGNKNDLPGIMLHTVQEADRLANGNTVICNWPGSLPLVDWPTGRLWCKSSKSHATKKLFGLFVTGKL
jgi:hypothetical protein